MWPGECIVVVLLDSISLTFLEYFACYSTVPLMDRKYFRMLNSIYFPICVGYFSRADTEHTKHRAWFIIIPIKEVNVSRLFFFLNWQ